MSLHFPPIHSDDGEAGFTLIELLVSLALMAMMSVYAVSALRTFGALERVSDKFAQESEVEATQRILRQLIGDTRLIYRTDENGLPNANFSGEPDALSLTTILNDRLERGGLYVLEFALNPKKKNLEMRRRLYRPMSEGAAKTVTIIDGIKTVGWRYCGMPCSESNPSLWPDTWEPKDRLPSRVALEIEFMEPGRTWRTLQVPLVASQ